MMLANFCIRSTETL